MSEIPAKPDINVTLNDLNVFSPGSFSAFPQFLLSSSSC